MYKINRRAWFALYAGLFVLGLSIGLAVNAWWAPVVAWAPMVGMLVLVDPLPRGMKRDDPRYEVNLACDCKRCVPQVTDPDEAG